MRRKFLLTLVALVVALGCALGLVACGENAVKIEFECTLNKDGASYAVTGATYDGKLYQSSLKDRMPEEVTVPAEYNGKPVTVIKHMNYGKNVKKVNLPDSIVEIGENAFENYDSLTSIKIGDNVEKIGKSAFEGITTLETVEFGESSKLKEIDNYAFSKTGIKTFKAPASLKMSDSSASVQSTGMFKSCPNLETIDLRAVASVDLGSDFATACPALKTVILPNAGITIHTRAFDRNNADKTTVYMFADALEGFGKINYSYGMSEGVKDELGAKDCTFIGNIHFYSESAPTNTGSTKYWHYVNEVPTKW